MDNTPMPTGWNPEWITADGCRKARVAFGDGDYAVVCACATEPIQKAIDAVMDLYTAAMDAGPKADEMAVFAALRAKLTGGRFDELLGLADDIIAECLVNWKVPGLAEIPAFGGAEPGVPNLTMDEDQRRAILRALPIPEKVRLVAGVFWQLKNSLGASGGLSRSEPHRPLLAGDARPAGAESGVAGVVLDQGPARKRSKGSSRNVTQINAVRRQKKGRSGVNPRASAALFGRLKRG